jgi:hypothetical protein
LSYKTSLPACNHFQFVGGEGLMIAFYGWASLNKNFKFASDLCEIFSRTSSVKDSFTSLEIKSSGEDIGKKGIN